MKKLLALLRQNWIFFLCATAAALALRFVFVFCYPHLAGDTFVYGDIAKNWLTHGIYGLTDDGIVRPTLIRLPGYPAFLAAMFSLFGREHYTAVMIVQALIDTNNCLAIAALTLELMGERAAKAAYLLAALCPFTANYTALPLAETLAIFCTTHTLYYGVRALKALREDQAGLHLWFPAGIWCAAGILLRPDGGLLLVPLGVALVALLFVLPRKGPVLAAAAIFAVTSLAPLVPWTVRNWRTFHLFQPLAPRYANDPGEFVPHGFNHWVRTWLVDYVSVEEVYWKVSGEPVDFHVLPRRAFDSRRQFDATENLIADYDQQLYVSPELDARFDRLARRRVIDNPFRYYVWLPFLRISDMWLRPRTAMLPVESRWWEFSKHPEDSAFALFWAALNLAYLVAALRGWRNWRLGVYGAVLIGFVLLRSAFLGSLENPEPRYMLECFPVVIMLAGGAFVEKDARQRNDADG